MTTQFRVRKSLFSATACFVLVLLQACASGPNANPSDPLEPLNRSVFRFNDGVDRAVLRPVATAYRDVTPSIVRTGVNNFFGNLADVWSLANNVLQLKPKESIETMFRVGVNTTIGLGGLIDVATEMQIEKHTEDFGQTLGYWGVKSGPYVVLPILGPSTLRDSVAKIVDLNGDLVNGIETNSTRNALIVLRGVDTRSKYLGAGELLDQAALDKYTFTRDFYLKRRGSQIVPAAAEAEERYDLPEVIPKPKTPSATKPSPQ